MGRPGVTKNIKQMMYLFHEVSNQCSRITAKHYSTSFSSTIKLLHNSLQPHIYNIYGFVRFADEIVDTFHEYDKNALLYEFRNETFSAIERGISINPILHSFQLTVNRYKINRNLVSAFLSSMELDLHTQQYDA